MSSVAGVGLPRMVGAGACRISHSQRSLFKKEDWGQQGPRDIGTFVVKYAIVLLHKPVFVFW